MKFKDITIKKNGAVIGTKSKGVWLEITDKKLFYLSWTYGRLYFSLSNMAIEIKDFRCNNASRSVIFRWDGEWCDNDDSIINVNDSYEVVFNSSDFDKIVCLVQ